MNELEIRKMLSDDVATLLTIEKEAYSDGECWTESDFLAELNNAHYYPFVCILENQIVGFCSAIIVENEMQITSVTVKSEFRNKKIATKMLIYLFSQNPNIFDRFSALETSQFDISGIYSKEE